MRDYGMFCGVFVTMSGRRRLGNSPNATLAILAGLLVSGCALSPFEEESFFRRSTTAVGATGKLPEPAPFVRESRPEETTFQPVGVTPKREIDPRTASGVRDLEKQLRDQQATSVKAATRPATPSTYDGKIEPGFKPPQPPPLPTGKAPDVSAPQRALTPAERAARRATRKENEGQ